MIMAGGTGGHVFPALAVAQELRAQGVEVSWLGTRQGFESRVVPEYGFPMEWVRVEGLRGNGLAGWLRAPMVLTRALLQSRQAMRQRRPGVVLGMGGFVTGPGGVMARFLGIPLVIHEQNSVPGLTNRWLAHLATRVLEAFPGSFPAGRARVCGNPVRREIAALPEPQARLGGRQGPPRLLVLGGSQGAQALNVQVPAGLAKLPPELRSDVRHQAGRGKREQTAAAYDAAGVVAEIGEFVSDMAEAYGWADLVICRAGALTVSELAAAGLGAILVPYPHAVDDHQTRNAEHLVQAGAAQLLPQSELTPETIAARLTLLLADRDSLLRMAQAARTLARSDAAEAVARVCLEVAR